MITSHDPDCLLTLALPAELEEELIDLLRGLPAEVAGFTLMPAEGVGAGATLATTVEQVRGRARRRVVQIVLSNAQVATVVDALRQSLPTPEIAWWTTPLSGFGRLA